MTTSGIVQQIKSESRYNKAFGSGSKHYEVKLTDTGSSELLYVEVPGKDIEDSDMAATIGKSVAIKCYRETPKDYCYASSYSFDGRELISPAK